MQSLTPEQFSTLLKTEDPSLFEGSESNIVEDGMIDEGHARSGPKGVIDDYNASCKKQLEE
jgi:hypothetical protein